MSSKNDSWAGRKLVVFHLRGKDRPCVTEHFSPEQLLSKLISYGAHSHNTTLYLMTDMDWESSHVQSITQYYSPYMFDTGNFSHIFGKQPFARNGFLIFAAEMYLQAIAHGSILTYGGHKLRKTSNNMGSLEDDVCERFYFTKDDTLIRILPHPAN